MTYPPQESHAPGGQPAGAPYGAPSGAPYGAAPGQPYPQPGFAGAPAPQAPKKKRKWPWIVAIIALVVIVGCIGIVTAVVGGAKEVVETLDDNANGKNAVAGEMGKAARDGKFEFVVSQMDCSKTTLGDSIINETAQGTFCVVTVKVTNIGQEAQLFDGSSQKAYDAKGTQFSNNTAAEVTINKNSATFLNEINPGNSVTGKLVFDVPKGTKLASIELHDSMFSGGVKIPLK
ncbi:DUF4352 domain-containing protein [Paractinoplanes atraurantiacus]|uniref:DUF4352 domain-containing protein n=1 Tax=Paractinoplanes atraurantiacus TaxID=1036182 RepID=A0A285JC86_9ACTN|nr:DUF4352 domain-containing protein [Actinoplanes atraurantiacus]SNY57862.1 protein of unknown function [Actinoplanes atraurantiacus]